MNALWIPVGSALAVILLSLGVLQVKSQGVRVDQSSRGSEVLGNPRALSVGLARHPR